MTSGPARGGARDRIVVALDASSASRALEIVRTLGARCTFYKVGLELFAAAGPRVVRELGDRGKRVFLDLKLHDIPNTAARATAQAARTGATFLTVHALGGEAMLKAAAAAAPPTLTLLGVTVLTSLDENDLGILFGRPVDDAGREADRLAALAREAGLGGVVCSAAEAGRLRSTLGPDATIATPGIRMRGDAPSDQRRVRSAGEALAAGATHIVVGRSVTGARDPALAFDRLLADAAGGVEVEAPRSADDE